VLRDSYRRDAFTTEDPLGEHRLDRLGEAGEVADAAAQNEDVRVEDVDGDGTVAGQDLATLLANWEPCP
jgi:hypothetical protein